MNTEDSTDQVKLADKSCMEGGRLDSSIDDNDSNQINTNKFDGVAGQGRTRNINEPGNIE